MGKRSATDKAIRNLMNWAGRPEWSEHMASVFSLHLGPVSEKLEIPENELIELIEREGWGGMTFGVMFEDFVGRERPGDGRNLVDDYLKRRGSKDTLPGRRYLQKLRDAAMSIYEIVDVEPGRHCDLRDLMRGGDPIRVHEKLGTENLVRWDTLAARVLRVDGRYVYSGGILPLSRVSARRLVSMFELTREEFVNEYAELRGIDPAEVGREEADHAMLRRFAPIVTSMWITDALGFADGSQPQMVNYDGEEVLFSETRFKYESALRDEIAERIDAEAEFEREEPGALRWVWLDRDGGDDDDDDGPRTVLGFVDIGEAALTLSTNSMQRAERGKALLAECLGERVGPGLTGMTTPENMAEHFRESGALDDEAPESELDPEMLAEIVGEQLDRHYRETLDEPIPMLGGRTPRECAGSEDDDERRLVIDWLKDLEKHELRRSRHEGVAAHDFGWMWEELGFADQRR